jgi:polysaccharide biosynthesis/export protein
MKHLGKHRLFSLLAVGSGMSLFCAAALGQFTGPAVSPQPTPVSIPADVRNPTFTDARIMPGDVVAIVVYGVPELTTSSSTSAGVGGNPVATGIKVTEQGQIVLPYIGAIKIAGMTPSEAAQYVAKQLKDGGFLINPQVTVEIVASPTRVITVIGEVQKPAPVPAFGQLRLLDVVSACGGFTPLASHTLTVHRLGDPEPITVLMPTNPQASDEANIPLMAGDTVIVPKVGNIFVVGQVRSPETIPLATNTPITVLRAISMSGGLNFGAAMSKTVILRTRPDHQHEEIQLDLKKIMDGKQKDVALISDDVLLVPRNGFKSGLAAGAGGIAASAIYGVSDYVR